MQAVDPVQIAVFAAWIATGIGAGFWGVALMRPNDAIRRRRLLDSGMVLVFAAILARILVQDRPMTGFDWALAVLSPVFIAAALWRLSRTPPLPHR